jgi:hypothetical protein
MDSYSEDKLKMIKTQLLNELEDELASKLSHNSYRKVNADMDMLMNVCREEGRRDERRRTAGV